MSNLAITKITVLNLDEVVYLEVEKENPNKITFLLKGDDNFYHTEDPDLMQAIRMANANNNPLAIV